MEARLEVQHEVMDCCFCYSSIGFSRCTATFLSMQSVLSRTMRVFLCACTCIVVLHCVLCRA
jgi:hypothetical protein